MSRQRAIPIEITTKIKGKRLRHTNILFTMNTNRQSTNMSAVQLETEKYKMTQALKLTFANGNFKNLMKVRKRRRILGENMTSEWIRSVKIVPSVEIGPKYKQIHSHVAVMIDHFTQVKVDYRGIRKQMEKHLGKTIYFNAKLIRTHEVKKIMIDYVQKDQVVPPVKGASVLTEVDLSSN